MNASIRTYTQEDPIGLAGGLNLYGFANGDPINFSDPFGLCPTCAILRFLTRPITITMANNQSWDRVSPNVQAGIDIAARFSGVNEVGVSWTTGGSHGRSSRHYPDNFGGVGMAADIYSLDGMLVSDPAAGDKVGAFQSILDMVPEARENFGPAMIHKEGKPYCTESTQACTDLKNDHKDHVHYSVNK